MRRAIVLIFGFIASLSALNMPTSIEGFLGGPPKSNGLVVEKKIDGYDVRVFIDDQFKSILFGKMNEYGEYHEFKARDVEFPTMKSPYDGIEGLIKAAQAVYNTNKSK